MLNQEAAKIFLAYITTLAKTQSRKKYIYHQFFSLRNKIHHQWIM